MNTSHTKSILLILLIFWAGTAISQEKPKKKVIQFTGVVFNEDSTAVLPGVHVYAPKGGRGTTTNPYGFFSMPALEGDSIIFSSVGYERTYYIVPKHDKDQSLKLLVYLQEDLTFLKEVEVFPYPSEAAFKQAVLAAKLPNQRDYDNIDRWLNSEVMQTMYWNLPASGNMNHRFFMQQHMDAQVNRHVPPTNPLLNPFAWANFIQSLRGN